eukprot:scaffold350_cov133-Cylindrotheca_fusiformis.AAC.12
MIEGRIVGSLESFFCIALFKHSLSLQILLSTYSSFVSSSSTSAPICFAVDHEIGFNIVAAPCSSLAYNSMCY